LAQPSTCLTWSRNLIFLLTLPYALSVIAFSAVWGIVGERAWWVALAVNFAPLYFLPAYLLLPAALILRARRALLLLLPLIVSSVVLYGGRFIPHAPPPAPAWSLDIIALNMSVRYQPTERIAAWLRAAPADVVVLVEASLPQTEIVPLLRDLYPYTVAQSRENAIAVLSRYPIRAVEGFRVGEIGYPRFARAALNVDGRPVTLIAASLAAPFRGRGRILLPDVHSHFINGAWDLLWGYDDDERAAEIAQIGAWLDGASAPVILAGDLNLVEDSADYRRVASRLVDSYRAAAVGFGFTFPAWEVFGAPPGLPGAMRIDYIWHTPDLVTVSAELGAYVGSDHLPVLATVGGLD
jgi:vancomycin resistance protein VanJ